MAVLSRLDILLHADTATATQSIKDFASSSVSKFDDVKNSAKLMGVAIGTSLVAGAGVIGSMIKDQVALANELSKTAQIANTSAVALQKYTFAAKAMGVEQEKLGDIFKDTQDKVGDFLSTGGGELQDFFKNVAPQVGITADSMRELSGPDALQAVYNGLEKANLSQSEMIYYMESIADEASLLIPLLENGGAGFKLWADAAENAGAVMDEKTIRASQELQASTDLLNLSYQGVKNQLTQAVIPVLGDLASSLVQDTVVKDKARAAGEFLAQSFKVIAMTGVGVVTIVTSIGKAIGGTIAVFSKLGEATNGVDWDSPFAFFQIGKNLPSVFASQGAMISDIVGDIGNDFKQADALMGRINAMGTTGTNAQISSLVNLKNRTEEINRIRGKTGKQIQDEIEATKSLTKEREKAGRAGVSSAVGKNGQTLIGVSGNSGIGSGAHLDIRYDESTGYSGRVKAEHLARIQANNRALTSYRISSEYGNRKAPVAGASTFHKGIDFAMGVGTELTTTVPVKDISTFYDSKGGGYVSKILFADGVGIKLLHQDKSISNKLKAGLQNTAKKLTSANTTDPQMMVFNAWKKAGLSDAQAKAFTAEVGRENDYNTSNMFGTHTDLANKKTNVGMLSWQGSRKTNLVKYLTDAGLVKNGKIVQSQDALNAQAAFAIKEILNDSSYNRTKQDFLGNKNIAYEDAYKILGDNYIRWDRDGSSVLGAKKAKEHAAKRDKYYAQINAKSGVSDGFGDDLKDYQKDLDDAKRLAEQQARDREQIERDFADKKRLIEMDLAKDIEKIHGANFDKATEDKYIAQAQQRADLEIRQYQSAQKEKLSALTDFAKSEVDKIHDTYQKQRDDINNNAEYQLEANADLKKQALKAIDEREAYELEKYQVTLEKKQAELFAYEKSDIEKIRDKYAFERQQIALNNELTLSQRTDELAANTVQEARDIDETKRGHRTGAVNLANDLTGNSELLGIQVQLQDRKQLVDEALKNEAISYQEHAFLITEIERSAYEARRQVVTTNMEGIAGSLSSITGELAGKQSRAYRVMFAVEKGFAIARSVMAIQSAIAQAFAVPFPANLAAVATIAAQTASIIGNIQAVRMPSGQAHDGIASVPREGTWILDKGERVVKPKDNTRLTQFLDNHFDKTPKQLNQNNPALNVQIHNNAGVDVSTEQMDDGSLMVKIDKQIKQSWQQLNNPNSHESRQLKNGFAVRPNRN